MKQVKLASSDGLKAELEVQLQSLQGASVRGDEDSALKSKLEETEEEVFATQLHTNTFTPDTRHSKT